MSLGLKLVLSVVLGLVVSTSAVDNGRTMRTARARLQASVKAGIPLKMYGHYCGPGHPDKASTSNTPPKDKVDEECRTHDICYEQANPAAGANENYYFDCWCNQVFVKGLDKVLEDNPDLPTSTVVFAKFAKWFFGGIPCNCNHYKDGKSVTDSFTWSMESCKHQPDDASRAVPGKMPTPAFCELVKSVPTAKKFLQSRMKPVVNAVSAIRQMEKEVAAGDADPSKKGAADLKETIQKAKNAMGPGGDAPTEHHQITFKDALEGCRTSPGMADLPEQPTFGF